MIILKKNRIAQSLFAGALLLPQVVDAKKSTHCTAKRNHTRFADFGKNAMPAGALVVSLYKQDWLGAAISQGLAHGLYALNGKFEHKIGKRRPCGCKGAFPSGHMIMYASSASYLHYRYGWQYGAPAYLATIAFSYDRVRNKAHSWGDMVGTFALTNLVTYLITPRHDESVEYLPKFDNKDTPQKTMRLKSNQGVQIIPIIQTSSNSHKLNLTFRY